MKLYHGSLEMVTKPEIREPNRTLDYGNGFYTTSSYDQALAWVKRRMEEQKTDKGFVNTYELDEFALKDLKCLYFDSPSEDWVDFVTDAIKEIYSSDTYKRLETEKTKLWHWGPVALLEAMEE